MFSTLFDKDTMIKLKEENNGDNQKALNTFLLAYEEAKRNIRNGGTREETKQIITSILKIKE